MILAFANIRLELILYDYTESEIELIAARKIKQFLSRKENA